MSSRFNSILTNHATKAAALMEDHRAAVDKVRENRLLSDEGKSLQIDDLIEKNRGELSQLREAYESEKVTALENLEVAARGYQDMSPAAVQARRSATTQARELLAGQKDTRGGLAALKTAYEDARFNGDSYYQHAVGHITRTMSGYGELYETYSNDHPDYSHAAGEVAAYVAASTHPDNQLMERQAFSESMITDTGNTLE